MNFELFLNIFIISEYIFASKLSRYFIKNLIKYLFFYIQKITSFFFKYFYPRIDPLSWVTKISIFICAQKSLKNSLHLSKKQFPIHCFNSSITIKKSQQSHETFSSPLRWTKFKVRKILSLPFSARSHCNEKSYRGYRSGGPPRLFFINRWNELWESVACFVIISRGLGTSFN